MRAALSGHVQIYLKGGCVPLSGEVLHVGRFVSLADEQGMPVVIVFEEIAAVRALKA